MSKGTLLVMAALGGEVIGALIPLLWGDDVFSLFSIIGGQIGAVIGIVGMSWLLEREKYV